MSWQFPFTFACVRHRRILADNCPVCHKPPRHTGHPLAGIPHPGHCHNPVAGAGTGPIASRCRGDLTALSDNLLTDPTQATGHHTRIAVAAGSPLRGDMLRVPHAVRQGQSVRVLGVGAGFRVASEGRAMSNAAPGERVRVNTVTGEFMARA